MNQASLKAATLFFLFATIAVLPACKKEAAKIEDKKEEEKELYKELEFSVLSYNVAGLPQALSSSDPERFMSAISPLLNGHDIVHVQEDFCYHDSLLLYNTHPYKTEPMPCVPDGDGLNTFSEYPISNVKRIAWTDCTAADCFTPKGFSYSQITFPDGKLLDFYNVHCNASSSVDALAARRANIKQLATYITKHSADKPVLLYGDFNCRYSRSGDSIRAILDLGFKDTWLETTRNGAIPEMNDNNLKDCDPDRNSFTCEKVDKIFFRSSDEIEISLLSFKIDDPDFYFEGNDTLDLSDHWPLFADFKLRYKVE